MVVTRAGKAAGLPFPVHRTCCATPAATNSPTTARTPAHCRAISASQHPAHGSVYRAGPGPVQELLAGLAEAVVGFPALTGHHPNVRWSARTRLAQVTGRI